MLALYRSGRQTHALGVYREARDALVEYGIEPTPTLRALEQAILKQDPSLEPPGLRGAATRSPRPILVLPSEDSTVDALLSLAAPLARLHARADRRVSSPTGMRSRLRRRP